MKKTLVGFIIFLTLFFNLKMDSASAENLEKGLYAIFNTSMGKIVCKLYPSEAPNTVANFVGLATGTKEYTSVHTRGKEKGKFYDGLIFHRVIPDFMIQAGCPLGAGIGDPGYKFADEFSHNLKHDKPGVMSMANSGPNTNGSQFFITCAPTPWLNYKHTIFGQVVEGMDVVNKIANVKKVARDKPAKDIVMETVEIKRVGAEDVE